VTLLSLAAEALGLVEQHGRSGCLIGGLAVSVRTDPRFTRDVDLAVAVADDASAEDLARCLVSDGLRLDAIVEQEAVGRLAMVRLSDKTGTSIDILVASSGIEMEIVQDSETLQVLPDLTLPVARVGHLIALKLLSISPRRETDAADLRALAAIADESEWARAERAVMMIDDRGYGRGRNLVADLSELRTSTKKV
jgi:predicted nucleotidyltransferase